MRPILSNGEILFDDYVVQFYVAGNDLFEQYRVKGADKKIYTLKLYDSAKLSKSYFTNSGILEVEILSAQSIEGADRFISSGEYVKESKKFHYIILDFISGESLHDKLKRDGVLSPDFSVSIIVSLLETLNDLHRLKLPIIHNNINTFSVLLDYSSFERPILSDFLFARYITDGRDSIDVEKLDPFYVSPELSNGVFTPQSDIFSVGALFYNILVGVPPWYVEVNSYQNNYEYIADSVAKKRKQELFFGGVGLEGVQNQYLIDVIKKSLSLDVSHRFNSVEDFIDALRNKKSFSYDIGSDQQSEVGHEDIGSAPKLSSSEGKGFSLIAGMKELKDILYNNVIRALNEKELYASYGVTIPNGMLLYGPPGCGKTFVSERFAEEVGFNFVELKPSDIKSKYINATEEKIGQIFSDAAQKAPTIIFIDEVDAVVPNRAGGDLNEMHSGAVNEFLAQMSNCSEKGIFVVAASNRPEKIDPAILRTGRIDKIIYLPPPDFDARVAMFKLYLEERPTDLGLDYDELAEITNDYVASDIKYLVDEASRYALLHKDRIKQEMFYKIVETNKPSVSKNELLNYEKIKSSFDDQFT